MRGVQVGFVTLCMGMTTSGARVARVKDGTPSLVSLLACHPAQLLVFWLVPLCRRPGAVLVSGAASLGCDMHPMAEAACVSLHKACQEPQ